MKKRQTGPNDAPQDEVNLQIQNELNIGPLSKNVQKKKLAHRSNAVQRTSKLASSKRLSADSFDKGDGSTHIDKDFDYDVAQMQAEKVKKLTQRLAE